MEVPNGAQRVTATQEMAMSGPHYCLPLTPFWPRWLPCCFSHGSGALSSQACTLAVSSAWSVLPRDVSLAHSIAPFKYLCKSWLLTKQSQQFTDTAAHPPSPPHAHPVPPIPVYSDSHDLLLTFHIIYLCIRCTVHCLLPCPHFLPQLCSVLFTAVSRGPNGID